MYPTLEQRQHTAFTHYVASQLWMAALMVFALVLLYAALMHGVVEPKVVRAALLWAGIGCYGAATWVLCTARERAWKRSLRPIKL